MTQDFTYEQRERHCKGMQVQHGEWGKKKKTTKKPYRKPWEEERKRAIEEKEGVQYVPFPGGCLLWW